MMGFFSILHFNLATYITIRIAMNLKLMFIVNCANQSETQICVDICLKNVWNEMFHSNQVCLFYGYIMSPELYSHNVVLDTTLCDKICQRFVTCRWFSSGILVSSTNKTDRHDITEISLKVSLKTINHILKNLLKLTFVVRPL